LRVFLRGADEVASSELFLFGAGSEGVGRQTGHHPFRYFFPCASPMDKEQLFGGVLREMESLPASFALGGSSFVEGRQAVVVQADGRRLSPLAGKGGYPCGGFDPCVPHAGDGDMEDAGITSHEMMPTPPNVKLTSQDLGFNSQKKNSGNYRKTAATCLITGAYRQITGGTSVNNIATLPNNTDILQAIPYEPQELLYNNQETPPSHKNYPTAHKKHLSTPQKTTHGFSLADGRDWEVDGGI
jgi:hypothetical protein